VHKKYGAFTVCLCAKKYNFVTILGIRPINQRQSLDSVADSLSVMDHTEEMDVDSSPVSNFIIHL